MRTMAAALTFGGLAALAACQVATPGEDSVTQSLGTEYCQAALPTLKTYSGYYVAPALEHQSWVVWPDTSKLTATSAEYWIAALVDKNASKVTTAYYVSDYYLPKFAGYTIRGSIAGPGTNPPPPPCRYPTLCGQMLTAYALAVDAAAVDAYERALACGKSGTVFTSSTSSF